MIFAGRFIIKEEIMNNLKMRNLKRYDASHRLVIKILLILAFPFILIAALLIFWFLLLFANVFMKMVFEVGRFNTQNDDLVWLWEIHLFPYGLFISAGTALIIWLVWKRNYKK